MQRGSRVGKKSTGSGVRGLRVESQLSLGRVTSPCPRVVLGQVTTAVWALTVVWLMHRIVQLTPFHLGQEWTPARFRGQLACLLGCPEALVRDPTLLWSLPWSFLVSGEISFINFFSISFPLDQETYWPSVAAASYLNAIRSLPFLQITSTTCPTSSPSPAFTECSQCLKNCIRQ